MRRALLVGIATATVLLAATPAAAQSDVRAGVSGTKASSTHEDEFDASVGWAFYSAGHQNLKPSLFGAPRTVKAEPRQVLISAVIAVRLGHEWGGGTVIEGLAGLRATNQSRYKYPIFIEALAGVAHYPGDAVLVMRPSVGIVFPKLIGTTDFYVKAGTPLLFFSASPELGIEGGAGFSFGKK